MPYINETLASIEKLQNVGKELQELTGELNIIISESLLCYRTKEVITNFHELAPNVKIKLQTMSCYATKQALVDGAADLGICYDEGECDERLKIHSLGKVPMILAASPTIASNGNLPDFTQTNVQIHTSIITDEPEGIFRKQFEKYIKSKKIILDSTIELWSIATIKNMVMSNLGITYVPEFTIHEELESSQLISLPHEICSQNIRAIYAYYKNKYISKQMTAFIELVEQYMKFD